MYLNKYCELIGNNIITYRKGSTTNDNPLRLSNGLIIWDNPYSVTLSARKATERAFNRLLRAKKPANNDLAPHPTHNVLNHTKTLSSFD